MAVAVIIALTSPERFTVDALREYLWVPTIWPVMVSVYGRAGRKNNPHLQEECGYWIVNNHISAKNSFSLILLSIVKILVFDINVLHFILSNIRESSFNMTKDEDIETWSLKF